MTFSHRVQGLFLTFCNTLKTLELTTCHALHCASVAAEDVVLEHLRDAKVSQKALSDALGVGRSMASLMLAGKRGISTKHLDALSVLLNMPVPQLFIRNSDLPWQVGKVQLRGNNSPADGVSTDAPPLSPQSQSQAPEEIVAGFVASSRLLASDASIIVEAAEALHTISTEINRLSRDADGWSAKLAGIFVDHTPSEDPLAGDAPSVHRDAVREDDRRMDRKKRRGRR